MWKFIKEWTKVIMSFLGLALVAGLMGLIIFFFFAYAVGLLTLVFVVFLLAIFCGLPITVKQKGVKIGTWRYGKFTPTKSK